MCGIVGAVSTSASVADLKDFVARGVSQQTHRGPDDTGIWESPGVVLGHNRLSIIDIGGGHQPMHDVSGRYSIVFNGEIYNYRDSRKRLETLGHSFSSSSDTEVLLQLYIEYGSDCLQFLNGMFAFAIWDAKEQSLFVARDRLGVKPIYYWLTKSDLRFSSELNALARPEDGLCLDQDAVLDYLTFLYVPAPRTIYAEIKKLPAGHWLHWKSGSVKIERYWNPWDIQPDESIREEEWLDRLSELFEDAVRLRLVSDVPLGAFLSGGVDSSAVVSTMARLMREPVKTFTIGFDNDAASELPFARAVAGFCGTDQTERIVYPPDVPSLLETTCRHFGEPFADSSSIPTLLVSELARERVTVALSGDGGDELFAGYGSYFYYDRLNRAERGFGPFAAVIGKAAERIPRALTQKVRVASKARSFLSKMGRPLAEQWSQSRSVLSRGKAPNALAPLLREQFSRRQWTTHLAPYFGNLASLGTADQLTRVDMQTYLAEELLTKVDRMSMARSLEVRSPFLDYRLVELALSIPMRFKMRDGQGKWILQRMLEGKVPKEILWRRKQGFTVPLENWFRGDLYAFGRDLLVNSRSSFDFVDRQGLEAVLEEHKSGRADHGSFLWALILLQTWMQRRDSGDAL
jgi:asparagine synthase (glutamine-hydrolysing)